MAAASDSKVHAALVKFLKSHNLHENVGYDLVKYKILIGCVVFACDNLQVSAPEMFRDVDDIVLQYVISILEDLGDSQNAEDNIDMEQFIDVMDAYIPGFKDIENVEMCEWMFQLTSSLSETDSQEKDQAVAEPTSPSLDAGLSASGYERKRDHLNSQGESERSTSESSQDDVDDQLQMLLEMFPQTLRLEVEQCFHSAERDVDRTVQLILHREETGTAITEESITKSKDKKKKSFLPTPSKKEKEMLIQRYAFIDVDEDKKTHRPPPPKAEPKKMVRYLDGQVVNTKGQKFTELKREDDEEMKKTYVNLKPARKYRFH